MQIKKVRLTSYASFADSGEVEYGNGINFIVGQNNSGKSALIKSLETFSSNPHRSAGEFRTERLNPSNQVILVSCEGRNLQGVMLRRGGQLIWPIDGSATTEMQLILEDEAMHFFDSANVEMVIERQNGPTFKILSGAPYRAARGGTCAIMQVSPQKVTFQSWTSGDHQPTVEELVSISWQQNLFFFNAQRYNIGRCAVNSPDRLSANASNLPAVLGRLKGNRGDVFLALTQHMRDIFPTVGNLSVTMPSGSAEVEVLVWPTIEQVHAELSTTLDESGTGLSQVLAILTVAMTMDSSVIVIDEISSFLHPAAAKALVRILEAHYSNHQYIISTHSPEVISACSPSTVHLVTKSGFTSSVTKIDVRNISDLRRVTGELGVSMTDVFASDRIVWVEGPTEELCFPYILEETRRDTRKQALPQFTAVEATDDFTAKRTRPELIFAIYDRLTQAAAALSGAATFAFDREELSEREMADLVRQGKGRVLFLPRRLIECYLISPQAIANVINRHLEANQVSIGDIEAFLAAQGGERRYKASKEWSGDFRTVAWLEQVDAAKLLSDLFDSVTLATLHYRKRLHSFEILKETFAVDAQALDGLIAFVHELAELSKS